MSELKTLEVLTYRKRPPARATVRRHYLKWRWTKGIPYRCDEPACTFHTKPLQWNDSELPLILDHKNGNNSENSPENLRFLCPNCDAQQTRTRGGANKGRVEKDVDGYAIVDGEKRDYTIIATGVTADASLGAEATVVRSPDRNDD